MYMWVGWDDVVLSANVQIIARMQSIVGLVVQKFEAKLKNIEALGLTETQTVMIIQLTIITFALLSFASGTFENKQGFIDK
mmetsp:Transcript_31548/g.36281  ORF Transcript_31548/g.36281 Transcript_31548/m.36281 type:complete len:81 (-) Transcript_31548:149-391(-)